MLLGQLEKNEKEWQYRSILDAAIDGLIIADLETGYIVEVNPAMCSMHGCARDELIGQHLSTFIHPDSQKEIHKYLRAFQSDGKFETQVIHLRQDGSTFFGEWRGTAFTFQSRTCILVFIRDVSKRLQEELQLKVKVARRSREQAKILEISQMLASSLEFHPGLILDQLKGIVNYSHGGLFSLEDSTLVAQAMRGTPQLVQSLPLRVHLRGSDILEALFNGRRPIRIADLESDTPQAEFLRSLLDDGAAVLLEGMRSWMWVPLAIESRIIGGIGVAETRPNYFTLHHANLALSVANQAAIAMVVADFHKRAQDFAVIEERQRLAHSLHDAVNQSLFSAGLIAEVLPRLWERDQQEARNSIQDLRRLTRGAQAEMRALLAQLRPSTITDSNLADLIILLANALTGRTNIPVTVNAAGDYILPSDVQIAFYHVCQEALFNVAKHSKASQVEVNLTKDGTTIELSVRDNGQGFDTQETFSGHYGLSMVSERASSIGALFSITSQPGHGTELTFRWKPGSGEESL